MVGPSRIRRILVVLVAEDVEQPQWLLQPSTTPLAASLGRLLDPRVRGREPGDGEGPEGFAFFDWTGEALPDDARVAEVPAPGIVVAVRRKLPRWLATRSEGIAIWMVRMALMRDERAMDRLQRFLASPDAAVEGAALRTIDVFVSYAFADGPRAAEVVRRLDALGLEVFLAESSLTAGRQWREQLRDAVQAARRALLLVTPSSIGSSWVLAEAGAFAWARKPTLLLLAGVERAALPAPLQGASFETADDGTAWWETWARSARARPSTR